jgi:hypothetical protein
LSLEAALKKWGEATLYAEMQKFSEWSEPRAFSNNHPLATIYPPKHKEYCSRLEAVEKDFVEKLSVGRLAGSGLLHDGRRREVIDPSLWEVLDLDYEFGSAGGNGLLYNRLEFFEPSDVPLNISSPIPGWLAQKPSIPAPFVADATYTHVTIHGVEFILSPTRAKVVQLLDEARLRGEEWQIGKTLLGSAGSKQGKMIDVFKGLDGWRHLIESNGRGRYRLNV